MSICYFQNQIKVKSACKSVLPLVIGSLLETDTPLHPSFHACCPETLQGAGQRAGRQEKGCGTSSSWALVLLGDLEHVTAWL